jgi:hypothetical protein
MSVKRKGATLASYAKRLKTLPRTVGIEVARVGASAISTAAQSSFDGGRTAHDDARPTGNAGNAVTLFKSGKLRAYLKFVSDAGTRIRCVLLEKYMGVMAGRFEVLPHGSRLPVTWKLILGREAEIAAKKEARP